MSGKSSSRWILVFALAACPIPSWANERSPCPQILFVGAETVHLTEVEVKLICGDPKTEGWNRIPLNQAQYFLGTFLQQRGYQSPLFAAEEKLLKVDPGVKSIMRSLTVKGLPPEIDPSKLRKLKKQEMTPKLLNKVKASLLNVLQNRGYACPEIDVTADSQTGEVIADVRAGRVHAVEKIVPAKLEGIDSSIFNRYEAFEYGKIFDMRLLTLTADRTMRDSLFLSAYYDVACSTAGMNIAQRVVEGKPRLYRVGVGFDTEGYAIGKAQWQNSRIGMRVSSLEGSLYASLREQSAETNMRYYLRPSSRLHLKPQMIFKRQNEIRFESFNVEMSVLPSTSWDNQNLRVDLAAGPAFEFVNTLRGLGPPQDTFFVIKTQVGLSNHIFEYHAGEPRAGWRISLESSSRIAGAYSSLAAHKFSIVGENLWNLGNYDPPLIVFGARYLAGTTYVNDRTAALLRLPSDMRFFLGGDSDIRGVARKELPGDDVGFLTVLYDGIELRMGEVLPYGIQPLVFLDGAMAGRNELHLDPDVYWSPGTGFRWRSPVGQIRGTLARGFVWHRDPKAATPHKAHWQVFFSFGKEF